DGAGAEAGRAAGPGGDAVLGQPGAGIDRGLVRQPAETAAPALLPLAGEDALTARVAAAEDVGRRRTAPRAAATTTAPEDVRGGRALVRHYLPPVAQEGKVFKAPLGKYFPAP